MAIPSLDNLPLDIDTFIQWLLKNPDRVFSCYKSLCPIAEWVSSMLFDLTGRHTTVHVANGQVRLYTIPGTQPLILRCPDWVMEFVETFDIQSKIGTKNQLNLNAFQCYHIVKSMQALEQSLKH